MSRIRRTRAMAAGLVFVGLVAIVGCGSSEDDTVASSGGSNASEKQSGSGGNLAGAPDGLPKGDKIPNDDGNNCKGHGLEAGVYVHIEEPFKEGLNDTRSTALDDQVAKGSTLEVRVEGDLLTWQVTKADTYVCDAFVKHGNGTWERETSKPLVQMPIDGNDIVGLYVTAYDPAFEAIGGDAS